MGPEHVLWAAGGVWLVALGIFLVDGVRGAVAHYRGSEGISSVDRPYCDESVRCRLCDAARAGVGDGDGLDQDAETHYWGLDESIGGSVGCQLCDAVCTEGSKLE